MSFLEMEDRGAKVIDRLSSDLVIEFPYMKGFPVRKLKNMRKFAGAWRDLAIRAACCCTKYRGSIIV